MQAGTRFMASLIKAPSDWLAISSRFVQFEYNIAKVSATKTKKKVMATMPSQIMLQNLFFVEERTYIGRSKIADLWIVVAINIKKIKLSLLFLPRLTKPIIAMPSATACLEQPIDTTIIKYGIATVNAIKGLGRFLQNIVNPIEKIKAQITFTP